MDEQPGPSACFNSDELRLFLVNPDDSRRMAELQRQFASILHANRCMKQKQNNTCTLPICPQWKVLFMHYNQCARGVHCTFENCASSRVLLEHYNSCGRSECAFCGPLRAQSGVRSQQRDAADVTVESSSGGFTSGAQAYYRKWGQWTETRVETSDASGTTTTFYQSTQLSITDAGRGLEMDVDKTERIQRELVVMLHVQKCADLDVNDVRRRSDVICAVPHCSRMKRTLIHLAMCRDRDCQYPECEVTRSIINHWARCRKESCQVCAPVLRFMPALDGEKFSDDGKLVNLLYAASHDLAALHQADVQSEIGPKADESDSRDLPAPSHPDLQASHKRHLGSVSSNSSANSSSSSLNSDQNQQKRARNWES